MIIYKNIKIKSLFYAKSFVDLMESLYYIMEKYLNKEKFRGSAAGELMTYQLKNP